jgi:hypothetical protein
LWSLWLEYGFLYMPDSPIHKPRVAWFSPLEGASVSAFCSRILLPILAHDFDLTVFHAAEQGKFAFSEGEIPTRHYLTARALHQQCPFDLFFYNVEDCLDLNFSRMHLALIPGIVWMHDFFMTTHGPEPILNSSWTETVKYFQSVKGSWPERDREYPAAKSFAAREVGMSFVSLFSNPRDLAESKRLLSTHLTKGSRRAFLLSHPVPEQLFSQPEHVRSPLVIGLAARPRVESHVHQFFAALNHINFAGKIIWPVAEIEKQQALEMVQEFGLVDQCDIRIGSGPEAWQQILNEINVAVHVRFSAYGQPAPELAMTLARGLPALLTDFAAGSTYSKEVVFLIQPGQYEVKEIAGVINYLNSYQEHRFEVGRRYASEFHHPRTVAAALRQIFINELPIISELSKRWRELEVGAHQELVRESLVPVLHFQSDAFGQSFELLIRDCYRELGWSTEREVQ